LQPSFLPFFASVIFAINATAQTATPSLILISVDGMKPEYVTQASQHSLKIPVLRSFLTHGSYAEGVIGVIPTVTYPSHTAMVTGVWPAEHGVIDNTLFDPLREHPNTWYWDFSDIKVPTLYTAADAAGIKTANVGWPVTVGAPIDYNIAEGTQRLVSAKSLDRVCQPYSSSTRQRLGSSTVGLTSGIPRREAG
jgi:predicted AlkP superfamily pyrophosphatase or phosphodiesterase